MKYIVMLGDGMADTPVESLNNKTPLEAAKKPYMDFLAQNGMVGVAKTIPDTLPPGSDTANLSVMGYDPELFYTGRSPLEAVSMGIELGENDIALRCNLVTLSDTVNFEDAQMLDYSAGEITTAESKELINFINDNIQTDKIKLYPGVSYRHCLVLKDSKPGSDCTPPHDISLKPIKDYLPKGEHSDLLLDLMKRSRELLKNHPINIDRVKRGLNPATSCWFWGEGTRPSLTPFIDRYYVKGAVISAVDLLKGIAICAGMTSVDVDGATGNIDTNFKGKAKAAMDLFDDGYDLVYIHVEAPDECGHQGDAANKVKAIELIDEQILGPVIEHLKASGQPYSILLTPDHPTPINVRTHVRTPVPFVIYRSNSTSGPHASAYTEKLANDTGLFVDKGCKLMGMLINND